MGDCLKPMSHRSKQRNGCICRAAFITDPSIESIAVISVGDRDEKLLLIARQRQWSSCDDVVTALLGRQNDTKIGSAEGLLDSAVSRDAVRCSSLVSIGGRGVMK